MPAGGGEAVQLTRACGSHPAESPDGRTVHYVDRGDSPHLWQVGAEGGEESQVLEPRLGASSCAVTLRGIYLLTRRDYPQLPYALEFFDFATRQTSQLMTLMGPRGTFVISSLSVSPDERFILYTQRDQLEFDLILLENFR